MTDRKATTCCAGATGAAFAHWDIEERSPRRLRYRLRRQRLAEAGRHDGETLETPALAPPAAKGGDGAKLAAENAQLKEQLLRARADFDNYRKRMAREREEQRKFANEALIKGLLETVDNLERAVRSAEQTGDIKALHAGVEMVHQQFIASLQRQGVALIAADPKTPFDPNVHEAVMVEANPDFENDTIIECLQAGYSLHSRVLRPAMVRVAKN